MGSGSEILIVDSVARDREGMRKLFDGQGYVCTAVGTDADARRLVVQKYFPVALIDLDVETQGAGLDLARYVREKSTATSVVLLTSRRSFEDAVEALRLGLTDVVLKSTDQVEHLKEIVSLCTERSRVTEGSDTLLRDVRAVLDESFKVMLSLSRKVYAHLSLAAAPLKPRILIVDGEQEFLRDLAPLVQNQSWDLAAEMNGGAALDRGMSQKFDIVAIRNELPDLRGSMVLRSIQAQRGETLGLLYSSADGAGRIDRMDQGQIEGTERPFTGAAQLADRIQGLVEELGTRAQERRFIQAFRGDHEDFMRRYAEVKLRIDRLISD
ncbi:MAG: response regulator [Sandaracinaceae bacterium]|nr:response regulator [Sandaracinaceae bacterium]